MQTLSLPYKKEQNDAHSFHFQMQITLRMILAQYPVQSINECKFFTQFNHIRIDEFVCMVVYMIPLC